MKDISISSPVVPANETGKSVDLESSVTENSVEEAIVTFRRAVKRLLNPSAWHELAGMGSAVFKLEKINDGASSGPAAVNDYISIDIPGPGPVTGDGYDWVQVVDITRKADTSASESFGLTVRASVNPAKPAEGTAHFFNEGATSTFLIKRTGNIVTASYHGRNEKPNTDAAKLPDKIRNTIVAAGALAGLSELQWNALIKALLQKSGE